MGLSAPGGGTMSSVWQAILIAAVLALAPAANADCVPGVHTGASARVITNLHFDITTGHDDLRGGQNDNVYVDLLFYERHNLAFALPLRGGLNHFARWADGSRHVVDVPLARCAYLDGAEGLHGIRLHTRFTGGVSGDNWNVSKVRVDWSGVDLHDGHAVSGTLLNLDLTYRTDGSEYRFTGDRRSWEWDVDRR
jgi:hypothetical protein